PETAGRRLDRPAGGWARSRRADDRPAILREHDGGRARPDRVLADGQARGGRPLQVHRRRGLLSSAGSHRWGVGSFENDAARDWFYAVEEAVEPGIVIASVLDDALAEAGELELDDACAAIAGAELLASCAGLAADHLPDHIRRWVAEHPHQPHPAETEQAVGPAERGAAESELSELWNRGRAPRTAW